MNFIPEGQYFYYITIALQAVCAIHCMRKGNQQKWIWLIVFLPIVGSLAYMYMEMFSGRGIQNLQSGMGAVLNPGGSIKRLEQNLKFSDTFANKMALADAYLYTGRTVDAIELYESGLSGNFSENEHALIQLVTAYFREERYEDLVRIVPKIRHLPQFPRSRTHIYYAMALAATGNKEQAEKEFLQMKASYSNYEARYQYGIFLLNSGRSGEGRQVLTEMLGEADHLSGHEKRPNQVWFRKAKDAIRGNAVK